MEHFHLWRLEGLLSVTYCEGLGVLIAASGCRRDNLGHSDGVFSRVLVGYDYW